MDSARSLGRQTLWIALGAATMLAQTACDTGNTVPDPPPTLNCPRLSMPDDAGQACTPLKTSGAKDAEMTFDSQQTPGGLIRLNGIVSAPQFDTPAPVKLPAVLLISEEGAAVDGALEGDTTGPFRGPVPVMADLAGALSERGFVVMRYDSRTCRACNYPATVAEAATWQDLLGDAIAAGEILQARPEVDPDDLIIIGHGQGATLALETQAQLGASALVLLGAPFNPIDKVLADRARWKVQNSTDKKAKKEAEDALAVIESSLTAVKEGQFPEDFLVLDRQRPAYYMGWIGATSQTANALSAFRGPILAVFGGLDQDTGPAESAGFEQALAGGKGQVASLPGHSHALHKPDGADTVSDEALSAVTDFLTNTGK